MNTLSLTISKFGKLIFTSDEQQANPDSEIYIILGNSINLSDVH
jgi:hypothetical protein